MLHDVNDDLYWNDFYIDLDCINAFYIARDPEFIENELVRVVVVYSEGENYTLKPEKHLQDYLLERFVKTAKKVG